MLGYVIENLLSVPILTGWLIGAASLLILSQIKDFFGFPVFPTSSTIIDYGNNLHLYAGTQHNMTTCMAILTTVVLLLFRKLWRPFPSSFLILCVTTFYGWYLQLDNTVGIKLLRDIAIIPPGLPKPINIFAAKPDYSTGQIFLGAFIICIVGFMEAISVAKKYAMKKQYKVSVNQELYALGFANIIGSFFQAYPITGSLSRTALNSLAGSRTPLSSIGVAIVIGGALLFATQVFAYTPLCVLAAVVVAAASNLLDYDEIIWLARVAPLELLPLFLTLIGTLLLGVEIGVAVAVILALVQTLWTASHPHIPILGHLPGTVLYKDAKRFPNATLTPGVLVVRMDARIFFANASRMRDKMLKYQRTEKPPIHSVVLDASSINSIDATGVQMLQSLSAYYKSNNIHFYWAGVKGPVREYMEKTKLTNLIGPENFFVTTHDAVQYAKSKGASQI